MSACVYVLRLEKSGYFYIGSSGNINRRIAIHKSRLNCGNHHNKLLQEAYNNDFSNILVDIIYIDSREEAFSLEQKMITNALNGPRAKYLTNIGLGVYGGDNLTRNPQREEIISTITESLIQKNSLLTEEERRKRWSKPGALNGMFGKTHSVEVRKRLSEINTGHSRNKGIKLSPEHIRKISERQKLRIGEKNSFYGRHHTLETKKILAEKSKGRIPPNIRNLIIENQKFISLAEASRYFNISVPLVLHRVKSKNYPSWNYL